MKKNTTIELNKILNNKTLGSSELESQLNSYFFSIRNDQTELKNSVRLVRNKLGHFTTINSYLNELNKLINRKSEPVLEKFFKAYQIKKRNEAEIIFGKISPYLKKVRSIITLSRSGTVLQVLKLWYKKNKKIKVVVCESRPKFEGRLTAEELARVGIKVDFITDAMMGIYIPQVDAAIIGADSVLKNGNVINKAGSYALALLSKEWKKPFYVVASESKFSDRNLFKPQQEDPKEIWNKMTKNLSISNIYFEEVPKKLITKIFTD